MVRWWLGTRSYGEGPGLKRSKSSERKTGNLRVGHSLTEDWVLPTGRVMVQADAYIYIYIGTLSISPLRRD